MSENVTEERELREGPEAVVVVVHVQCTIHINIYE